MPKNQTRKLFNSAKLYSPNYLPDTITIQLRDNVKICGISKYKQDVNTIYLNNTNA